MKYGNRLSGASWSKGYKAIWLYPIGVEMYSNPDMDLFEISLILQPLAVSFNIRSNITLFRND